MGTGMPGSTVLPVFWEKDKVSLSAVALDGASRSGRVLRRTLEMPFGKASRHNGYPRPFRRFPPTLLTVGKTVPPVFGSPFPRGPPVFPPLKNRLRSRKNPKRYPVLPPVKNRGKTVF